MSNRSLKILLLFLVLWFGYFLFRTVQDHSRVSRLPKQIDILGQYSAKDGIPEAKRIAALWDPDCQLQCIFVAFGGDPQTDDPGLGPEGIPIAPSGWNYRFFSASRVWFLDLILWPDGRCEASSFSGLDYLDTKPLPAEFLDSTEALAIAEKLYGKQYRNDGDLFRTPTRLTTWRLPYPGPRDPVPHRATWQIHYLTTRGQDRVDLHLTLDAVTGEELCAVEIVNTKVNVLTDNYQN